jgi:hypothetical protein
MKTSVKKLAGLIAEALLDAAHEVSKNAVNEAVRQVHAELEKKKTKTKKKIAGWAGK